MLYAVCFAVPVVLVLYGLLAPFLFGAAVTRLLTVVAKYGVGKLRPNFLTRCGYEVYTEFCSPDKPQNLYRSWFVCPTTTAVEQLVDMRLGFVSGHASLAAYAMSYMVLAYLSPMKKNCAGAHPPAVLRGENGVQGAPYSAFPTAASAV
ncbi:hypothetical protein V5799_026232 [Amblyomma americanum]|uniref:Phosphatidic acid phosphatase type 2/haloperoxidase domain-containing protein n=1 Tax=Amblyomma americanum TaxID=6943 RepID=A0AAQ4DJ61_AMBAM